MFKLLLFVLAALLVAVSGAGASGTATPKRIVSLSATATESLFAIGAGPQVIAADDQSDYPKNAPKTSLSGFTPNVEAIAGYKPDLVVLAYDPNNLVSTLRGLGIRVLEQDAATSLADAYGQITALGKITGHAKRGRLRRGDDEEDGSPASSGRHAAGPRPDRLPRARPRPVLGDLEHVHRQGLRALRAEEHRRRRRHGRRRLPEALGRVRRLAEPRPHRARRHHVLRAEPEDRRLPARLVDASRRCAPGRSCGSTTRSPRAGGRASSTSCARSRPRSRTLQERDARGCWIVAAAGFLARRRRHRGPRRAGAHRPVGTCSRRSSTGFRSSTSTRSSRRRRTSILWEIRLPRVVLAALVGAMLSLAGASYQGVFRNPLADPYLLGVAAGAGPRRDDRGRLPRRRVLASAPRGLRRRRRRRRRRLRDRPLDRPRAPAARRSCSPA